MWPSEFHCADADGVGLARNTSVADIDIVIARGEIATGLKAQGDVVAAGGVANERMLTDGRVVVAGGVVNERIEHRWPCCVPVVLLKSACTTGGRVALPVVLFVERTHTVGRVVAAGGVVIERIEHQWPCCERRWCC